MQPQKITPQVIIISTLFLWISLLSGCFTNEPSKQFEDLQSPNMVVRNIAIQGVIKDKITEAGPELLKLLTPEYPIETRMLAIEALGILTESKAVAPLQKIIENDQRQLAEAAIESLGKIKDDSVVDFLIKLSQDRELIIPVMWTLGQIGGEQAVQVLTELLDDPDKRVKYNAYQALKAMKDAK